MNAVGSVPERQLSLALEPINHFEKHSSFEHLTLEIGRVLLPIGRLANSESWLAARFSAASSAAKAPRMASYIKVKLSFVKA